MRVVLATSNRGKLREFAQLLAGAGFELVAQGDFVGTQAVPPVAETGLTFLENALLKARHAALHTGLPALADDSGLSVDGLGGAPGIWSARYTLLPADSLVGLDPFAVAAALALDTRHGDDAGNNARLLSALAGAPPAARRGRYHCALAFVRHAADPVPLVAAGSWEGRIGLTPRGEGGFGYDPLFEVADGRTAAELPDTEKHALSHRGAALRSFLAAWRHQQPTPSD
ncbi:MAG: RdgB/HAM1 family non-canonical purine NTP pyrophosphatase [Gammaproteobacteria bacterium]